MADDGTLPPVPAELEKWRDEGTVKDLTVNEIHNYEGAIVPAAA
jgi:hypothetical protein